VSTFVENSPICSLNVEINKELKRVLLKCSQPVSGGKSLSAAIDFIKRESQEQRERLGFERVLCRINKGNTDINKVYF
jgi:hypothetical protein